MTRINFPAETPAARITDFGLVDVDGTDFVAHHFGGEVWNLQPVGKRGPVNAYHVARVVGGKVVHIGSRTRF